MKFYTAILKAIDAKRQIAANFSAHEITKFVRNLVNDQNSGTNLSDRVAETRGGINTFRVDHNEVKEYIRELKDNGLLANYNRDEVEPGGNYSVFIYEGPPALQNPTISPAVCCSASKAQAAAFTTPLVAKFNYTVIESKIRDYVQTKHGNDEFPSAKMIQSRMKGFSLTCRDIVDVCEFLGFETSCVSDEDKSTYIIYPA